MPWRKPWNASLSTDERSQRAYEVWVSEIMLQQTQVATVIPYYDRWMKRFPTVHKLAEASIEDVNAVWKGLGYYSRASRLHAGSKVVQNEYAGIIPSEPAVLEKSIPGIGRYSAGAICSIAHGSQAPVLDGNVHRLLSRILGLHANPTAKRTLAILWQAATDLVTGASVPGDLNQALIELGSTVCKPRAPSCAACPVQSSCVAYRLGDSCGAVVDIEDAARPSTAPTGEQCSICIPLPITGGVTRFPMAKVRKKPREEIDAAFVISCSKWVLLAKRPEKGLLGGLWEFPTVPADSVDASADSVLRQRIVDEDRGPTALQVKSQRAAGDVLHIFSHIRKTWQVMLVELEFDPELSEGSEVVARLPELNKGAKWVRRDDINGANLGTGTMKVWQAALGLLCPVASSGNAAQGGRSRKQRS
ncbi:DNA glycosylase [Auriculariales sp. MPI-PUGE-AT-0066]|nr:DNA glycosylase [Auriculariales sp. MPI-PUGE-AT-0066]